MPLSELSNKRSFICQDTLWTKRRLRYGLRLKQSACFAQDVFELVIAELNKLGTPAAWLHWWPTAAAVAAVDGPKAGTPTYTLGLASFVARSFDGQAERPDVAACVASGLFDICLEAMVAFEAAGVEGLRTVAHGSIYSAMSIVTRCRMHPGCTEKIRELPPSVLAFCLEYSVDMFKEFGQTTGSLAAQLCTSCRAVRCFAVFFSSYPHTYAAVWLVLYCILLSAWCCV